MLRRTNQLKLQITVSELPSTCSNVRCQNHMPRPLPGPGGPPAAPAAAFALARAATARPLPPTPVATFFACVCIKACVCKSSRTRDMTSQQGVVFQHANSPVCIEHAERLHHCEQIRKHEVATSAR